MSRLFGFFLNTPKGDLKKEEDIFASPLSAEETPQPVSSLAGQWFSRTRFLVGTCCFLAVGIFYLGRAVELQILQGNQLRALAEHNRLRQVVTLAHRGRIFDRNGIVLAENIPKFHLLAEQSAFSQNTDLRQEQFAQIAFLCGLDMQRFTDAYAQALLADYDVFLLDDTLSYECAMKLMSQQNLPFDVRVEVAEDRSYLTTEIPSLSHVLGYISSISDAEYEAMRSEGYRPFDDIGKQGLEKEYETLLRGIQGVTEMEVDAGGGYLRTIKSTAPQDGVDLTLSLDARLQAYIERVLNERLGAAPVKRAAVVMMNPKNGEVLALVSYPAFDANSFVGGISQDAYTALIQDPNAPLFNRVISGEYPSGSTIKPLYASAALTEGIITPQTTFLSTGGLWLGDRFFPDWRAGGHGITNVYHAIADSVNTYFYAIGGGTGDFVGLGVEKLTDWARVFGLGVLSDIDLPGEAEGFLPSKAWKLAAKGEPWYIGDTYNVSIGQGDVLVTPLQITRAIAAIANNGLMVVPHLRYEKEIDQSQRVIEEDIASVIQDAMRQTVTAGSAQMMQSVPVAVAGKTGTAQWSQTAAPHSWFTGFAPFDDPEVVITVLIEQGGDASLASPVARDILQWYFGEGQRNIDGQERE